ncbi:cal-8 [Pristionchus pacificus]|uniref:Cal-8 n=1 Tax=Pristionchus pacificus TaxID=54126 RepID=A0A2A6B9E1_PRIPA|nr:cal-8 [Pristionchus pacificus]|eukprot:PDM62484.1 cal-8 [Pristionchus pacificus]
MNIDSLKEQELREIFKEMDKNGDGRITSEELECALVQVGEKPTTLKIREMMAQADTDGNGCIEIDEFLSVLKKQLINPDEERELKEVFRFFDRNGDGLISVEELSQVMMGLGEELTLTECKAMIREGDLDNDGMIDFREFICLIKSGSKL